jgi:hypothetical protein
MKMNRTKIRKETAVLVLVMLAILFIGSLDKVTTTMSKYVYYKIPSGIYNIVISTLTTNEPDVANSVWAVSNGIRGEGTTANEYEATISFGDPTADVTLSLPTGTTGAFVMSSLTTNAINAANSIWGATGSSLVMEGNTADEYELTVQPLNNPAADRTVKIPSLTAGTLMLSTLTTNDVDVANSVWGISNGLALGGATGADGFELQLKPLTDPSADKLVSIPSLNNATAMVSTLTTNDVDAANSVWGKSGNLCWEGTSADGVEICVTSANGATPDKTITLPDADGTVFLSTLATNAPEAANSWWGASNALKSEGTANDYELTVQALTDPTADKTVKIPSLNDAVVAVSTLATNDVDAANSIWLASNAIVMECLTGNTYELSLAPADQTTDHTVTFADASGTAMLSTLATNAPEAANSFWSGTGLVTFEGTANEYEFNLGPLDDPTADKTVRIPSLTTGVLMLSTLASNDVDVADSVWFATGSRILGEGSSADGYEFTLTGVNPTQDNDFILPNIGGDVPVVLKQDMATYSGDTVVVVTGCTVTLPAGMPPAGASIRLTLGGIKGGTAAAMDVLVLAGTTTLQTLVGASAAGDWEASIVISELTNLTTQKIIGRMISDDGATSSSVYDTGTFDFTTGAHTLTAKISIKNAADSGSEEMCIWEYLP